MQEPLVNGWLVVAGQVSPEEAFCPSCGGAVKKRKRQRMDGRLTTSIGTRDGWVRNVRGASIPSIGGFVKARYR